MLPTEHPLAGVNDVFNAVFVEGDALGEAMFMGRGAGGLLLQALCAAILSMWRAIWCMVLPGALTAPALTKSTCAA